MKPVVYRYLVGAIAAMKRAGRSTRVLGMVTVAIATILWVGIDSGLLTRWFIGASHEQDPIATMGREHSLGLTKFASAAPISSGALSSLLGGRQWLNTQPLRPQDLQGKVVLVNFWTYTCVNSLRALPYLRAWAEKYKDRGLVVVGVHTPEFAFERDVGNVSKQSVSLDVGFPVVIDNDYRIWRAFGNRAWPAFYFIDGDGRVRRQVLGERDYDQSERLIQELLSEANRQEMAGDLAAVAGMGLEKAADWANLRSPETYIGYAQSRRFVSPGGINEDTPTLYRAVGALPLNRWSLAGIWTIGREFATLNATSGKIAYRFHSRDLHLVLAAATQGQVIRFRVRIDGTPPHADHGFDVDSEGWGSLEEGRMYQLVRQSGTVKNRLFEIEFFDAGVRAYVFTFG